MTNAPNKTAVSTAVKAATGGKVGDAKEGVKIRPISQVTIALSIVSTTPMIQHRWSEKARQQMRDKHAGKKTRTRDIRDPQAEFEAASYRTEDGQYGIPAMALKSSVIGSAHKDLGIEKTLVRKSLFLRCDDPNGVLPIKCAEPAMREDTVRVGASGTDLRYRPEFKEWTCRVTFEIDAELLQVDDLVALINRAGFGVGIGEMRPEKGGDYGRFRTDGTVEVIGTRDADD